MYSVLKRVEDNVGAVFSSPKLADSKVLQMMGQRTVICGVFPDELQRCERANRVTDGAHPGVHHLLRPEEDAPADLEGPASLARADLARTWRVVPRPAVPASARQIPPM